jgi:uncharacterized cupredoxin-like copper-binding protein
VVLLAACGGDDPDPVSGLASGTAGDSGTIEIEMVDIAFQPDEIEVAQGETVRLVFTNSGEVVHDAFIGDAAAQAEHEREMREAGDEGHDGMDEIDDTETTGSEGTNHADTEGDDEGITVQPGDAGEMVHTFDEPGELEIGCHEPGHYDAGMIVHVTVT